MIAKLLELVTGKDDFERVAYKGGLDQINAYLKTRRLLIPRKPKRFLDASSLTEERLLELVRQSSEEMAGDQFEPWILEIDGKKAAAGLFQPEEDAGIFQQDVAGIEQGFFAGMLGVPVGRDHQGFGHRFC